GEKFLLEAVRPDGSWPIDSNLSVWVTTLSINALHSAGVLDELDRRAELQAWLLAQQGQTRHPYTGAEPGAWGWTHLPGNVPDADDTPGALLALAHLSSATSEPEALATGGHDATQRRPAPPSLTLPALKSPTMQAADAGLRWLVRLQNRDGGWPTFCRGWGHL